MPGENEGWQRTVPQVGAKSRLTTASVVGIADQARWVQRTQRALVQMNIQLGEVVTDVMSDTGRAIIRTMVADERDP